MRRMQMDVHKRRADLGRAGDTERDQESKARDFDYYAGRVIDALFVVGAFVAVIVLSVIYGRVQ